MRLTFKGYAVAATVILMTISFFLNLSYKHRVERLESENEAVSRSLESALKGADTYRTKAGQLAYSIGAIELKASELEKLRSADAELIKSLRIDKKRLQTAISVEALIKDTVKVPLRDTVVIGDNKVDTLKSLSYHTEVFNIEGSINGYSFDGTISARIGLKIYEHIVPKKFLFFKFGVKSRRLEVVPSSNDIKIINVEYTKIKE